MRPIRQKYQFIYFYSIYNPINSAPLRKYKANKLMFNKLLIIFIPNLDESA